MRACEAYYSNGKFIPVGFGKLPEGTKAIITLLNEVPQDINYNLKAFDSLLDLIHEAADEEIPPFETMKLREVEL